jgi:hypothetical protein
MEGRLLAPKEVLIDIKNGLGMSEIMEKHGLSTRNLQGIVTILLDAKLIDRKDLYGEFHDFVDTVFPEYTRQAPRIAPDTRILIYDSERPEVQGHLMDINEDGIGVVGIDAKKDEIKTLVILGDAYGESEPIELKGLCRWAHLGEGGDTPIAGFQIVGIDQENMKELEALVRQLTLNL